MSATRTTELPRGGPLLLLAVVVLILYFARELLVPFAFALTLSFLLAPAVNRLEALRLRRLPAVILTVIVSFTIIAAVGYIGARQLLSVAQTLPSYRLNIQQKMAALHSPAEQSVEKAITAVEDISGDLASTALTQPAAGPNAAPQPPVNAQPVRIVDPDRNQLQYTAEFLMRILKPIGSIGVVVVFTIYLLLKREDLRHRILLLAGMGRISLMTQALQDAASRISQYLVLQAAVNAAYGIFFGIGLYLIGVPDATLWGVIAGILRVVPYVGTATGLVLPLVVSIAISTSWWPPLLILALFLVLELSTTNIFEPWLYGSRTGISSLALLAMAIFWALLWGWPGLILSTPLTVCIVVLGRYVPQMSFLHTLLGTDAELSAEAHFYERLLAMDQQEARAIATRFLSTKPLIDLYDEVFIPALSLVEQDRHQGTLDDSRCSFFFLSIGELIAEFTDSPDPRLESGSNLQPNLPSSTQNGQQPDLAPPTPPPFHPKQSDFAVICISASDQADELGSLMLAQLIEHSGHPTLLLSAASVSHEILEGIACEPNTVVFISAMPPFAFSQARAICLRLRAQLPSNRIVIGLWNTTDDPDQLQTRFGNGKPNVIVTNLAQALQQVSQWRQSPALRT